MRESNSVDGWRQALGDLERVFVDGEPIERLGQIAEPEHLGLLFRLRLDILVRQGPVADGFSPQDLLGFARRAAKVGLLPLRITTALHAHLPRLASLVKKCGAWKSSEELWWEALPKPPCLDSPDLEDLWKRLDSGTLVQVPSKADLETALTPDGRRWLAMPRLLTTELAWPLWSELEDAYEVGRLDLERGGVGGGKVSTKRSDEVQYFSGLEPELLRVVPHLAAFIQWSLDRWGRRLSGLVQGPAHRPSRAMLARYPAPSSGYAAHMDNPGGGRDNGRVLTLVIYLNGPGQECCGGEISLWAHGTRTTEPPEMVVLPASGSAVIFDARTVAHRVEPVGAGRPRWALTLWFNDTPQTAPSFPIARLPTLSDVLRPLEAPPLPEGVVLFHELDEQSPGGEIIVHRLPPQRPRAGVVATVYRGGSDLEPWCRHHFENGIDHAVLVFDHLEDPEEAEAAEGLRKIFTPQRLTVFSGVEVAQRWSTLPRDQRLASVRRLADFGGASSYAVASRQALNASVVLQAARSEELGGRPLDWLVHLDADEFLLPLGAGRGGGSLAEHFAAASAAGLKNLRFVNHELLPPRQPGDCPRFKVNPRLAVARLGLNGWTALVDHLGLGQTAPRPWFHGYFNGKSAVAVADGLCAAGVHGWFLKEPDPAASRLVAGPVVLHFHYRTSAAFRFKYLGGASAGTPPGPLPFKPCPAEEAALDLVNSLRVSGVSEVDIEQRLDGLHRTLTTFSEGDLELLEEAGLIFAPQLKHWLK